jgi:hypothetical protein
MLASRERTLACHRVSEPPGGIPGTPQGRAVRRGTSGDARRIVCRHRRRRSGSENIDCSMTKMNGTRWGVMLFKSLVKGVQKKNVVGWRSTRRNRALGKVGPFAPLVGRLGLPAGLLPQPRAARRVCRARAPLCGSRPLLAGQATPIETDARYPEGPIAQNGSGRVLVAGEDRKLVRIIDVPTPYLTNIDFGPDGAATVFVTGAFEQGKPPFPGAVDRWVG